MKRKRSKERQKDKKARPANPFLEFQIAEFPSKEVNQDQEHVLSHVVRFSERSNDDDLHETVEFLIAYLNESNDEITKDSLMSPADVANMLLPWAVKHLLYEAPSHANSSPSHGSDLKWRTLQSCLTVLLACNDDSSTSSCLSQSALHKLVPYCAQVALCKEEVDAAAACYTLLVDRFYHPNTDLAYHSILPLVDECVAQQPITADHKRAKHQLQVLGSTLTLLQRIQGTSNPKKTFQLIIEPKVMSILSRWHCLVQENEEIQSCVRELLWEGLFNPIHHIDGFRSMNMPVPSIELSTVKHEEIPGTDDEDKPHADPKKTKHKQKGFAHCYQESLLTTLGTMIDTLSCDNEASARIDRAVVAAHIIPELLDGFIRQSNEWERNVGSKSRKKDANFMAMVQFRLWSNLVGPMMLRLCRSVLSCDESSQMLHITSAATLSMVRSIRETLTLVLKHSLYLPSYPDKDHVNFLFLQNLTSTFLEILEIARGLDKEDSSQVESECLQGLETLLCLNHLVVHERLSELISACVLVQTRPEECSEIDAHRRSLVTSIINTYHRLRQLDHLFRSLLSAADMEQTSPKQKKDALCLLKRLFHETDVQREFAAAIQNCPPGQVQDLFHDLSDWIQKASEKVNSQGLRTVKKKSSKEDLPTDEAIGVSFAVNLFVLLIRNVRVDHHTSVGIATLCDEAMKMAARPLIAGTYVGNSDNHAVSEMKRHALVLCGWLLDLRTRCAFWLNESDQNGDTFSKGGRIDVITSILEDLALLGTSAGEGTVEGDEALKKLQDSVYGTMLDEVQFLMCHRICELHSLIHEERCVEMSNQENSLGRSRLTDDANRLVALVVAIAEKGAPSMKDVDGMYESRWKTLAETAAYWAPYSSPHHVDPFLQWMFTTLAVPEEDGERESVELYPGGRILEQKVFSEERAVAEALLHDSSFFEITEFATRFHSVGIGCVADLLRLALATAIEGTDECEGSIVAKTQKLVCDLGGTSCCSASMRQWGVAMKAVALDGAKNPFHGRTIREDLLRRTLRTVQLLNAIPQPSTSCSYLDTAVRLDVLLCAIYLKASPDVGKSLALPLLCAVRTFAASSLLNTHGYVNNAQELHLFLREYLQTTSALLSRVDILDTDQQRQLLRVSGMLIEAIAASCLAASKEHVRPIQTLVECFAALILDNHDSNGVFETRVLLNMSRSLVKRVVTFTDLQKKLTEDEKSAELVTAIRETFGKAGQHRNFLLQNDEFRAEWLLLMGDALRLSSSIGLNDPDVVDLELVRQSFEDDTEQVVKRAASYYLACKVATGGSMSASVSDLVVGQCLAATRGCNQLQDATFCELVRGMGSDELRCLLEHLLSKAQSKVELKISALHLFCLLIEHVKNEHARSEISCVARKFFALGLQLLHPSSDELNVVIWAKNVDLSISLIIALTQQKDIITVRERDLALVLAHVHCTLGPGGSFRTPDVPPSDDQVYSSCSRLVSALLQRFPKQLYSCVPCVVSAMHGLLSHAVYGTTLSELELTRRAQLFTRLCELLIPHRDVYKKHVLGLILEFVGVMRGDVRPSRSKGIVPAIYCLLDILSQYEIEQLNTMMDDTAKALFRSVYQSHQKTHIYKGQY